MPRHRKAQRAAQVSLRQLLEQAKDSSDTESLDSFHSQQSMEEDEEELNPCRIVPKIHEDMDDLFLPNVEKAYELLESGTWKQFRECMLDACQKNHPLIRYSEFAARTKEADNLCRGFPVDIYLSESRFCLFWPGDVSLCLLKTAVGQYYNQKPLVSDASTIELTEGRDEQEREMHQKFSRKVRKGVHFPFFNPKFDQPWPCDLIRPPPVFPPYDGAAKGRRKTFSIPFSICLEEGSLRRVLPCRGYIPNAESRMWVLEKATMDIFRNSTNHYCGIHLDMSDKEYRAHITNRCRQQQVCFCTEGPSNVSSAPVVLRQRQNMVVGASSSHACPPEMSVSPFLQQNEDCQQLVWPRHTHEGLSLLQKISFQPTDFQKTFGYLTRKKAEQELQDVQVYKDKPIYSLPPDAELTEYVIANRMLLPVSTHPYSSLGIAEFMAPDKSIMIPETSRDVLLDSIQKHENAQELSMRPFCPHGLTVVFNFLTPESIDRDRTGRLEGQVKFTVHELQREY